MRRTISQLLDSARSGSIGYRGLHRLQAEGIDPDTLAASGVGSDLPDPDEALATRREGNFLRAVQRAQQVAATGGDLDDPRYARTRQRLHQGSFDFGSSPDAVNAAPLSQMLEHYRRRRGHALSNAGQYEL